MFTPSSETLILVFVDAWIGKCCQCSIMCAPIFIRRKYFLKWTLRELLQGQLCDSLREISTNSVVFYFGILHLFCLWMISHKANPLKWYFEEFVNPCTVHFVLMVFSESTYLWRHCSTVMGDKAKGNEWYCCFCFILTVSCFLCSI